MVKFSKELEAQLIPEWKEAFVNYWQLKKHIKRIKQSKLPEQSQHLQQLLDHDDFGRSILDPIRSLSSKLSLKYFFNQDTKVEIIEVRKKNMEDGDEGELYHTDLSQLFSEEDEVREFFEKLDQELNKVNQFYMARESEFVDRGKLLNKHLEILVHLKRVLNERRKRQNIGNRSQSVSSTPRASDYSEAKSDAIETPSEGSETDDIVAALERNGVNFINSATKGKTKNGKPKMTWRIDIPATTPTSAVTSVLWEDLVNNTKKEGHQGDQINRKKIQCDEKKIRSAFVELYRGLGLLKTYSSLNMVAFTKILKKFDKVSSQQASASYLRAVKSSHFVSSDKVVRLMDEVETIFTTHFANNDKKKAMKFLKPQQQKESHMVTFFVGLFTGCFVSLFSVYAFLAHLSGLFRNNYDGYVETVYPVFSVFALLSLHLFMYGCNLFMWKSTRINYEFIFELQPNTALKCRDAFLICTTFMTSVVAAMVIHLLLRAHNCPPSRVDAIPGILLLIFMALLICPFDIFYRSTRYYFIRIMRNIICTPFYKVLMVDFFMADQLTSQIPMFRYMESTACYFLAGSFKTHEFETCKSGTLYKQLAYVFSFLPYYFRAMQCARRWHDESDPNQLANMGKYVSAMLAASVRLTYAKYEDSPFWLSLALITSVGATIYQLYWDFVKDWGFFNPKSKNRWLRDELILKNKSTYYVSIALNVILRIVWVETVLRIHLNNVVESRMLEFFLASLEVIRRGHWNFYRLENEHLSNCGNFRAVKAVPLPFCETDSN